MHLENLTRGLISSLHTTGDSLVPKGPDKELSPMNLSAKGGETHSTEPVWSGWFEIDQCNHCQSSPFGIHTTQRRPAGPGGKGVTHEAPFNEEVS
jgi:hypothetical protein